MNTTNRRRAWLAKRNSRFLLACLLILGTLASLAFYLVNQRSPGFFPPELDRLDQDSISVMTVNVGNIHLRCTRHDWKLCRQSVEDRIAENLRIIRPELIAVQELLPNWECERRPTTDPALVCSQSHTEPQIRRLLGPDYTIVCDGRNQFECVGVRTDAGEIEGCPLGGLCKTDRLDQLRAGCRDLFSIMAVEVRIKGRVFDVVNGHPESRSSTCRAHSVGQIFGATEGAPVLVEADRALILGDMNLDPWRWPDRSTRLWERFVGLGEGYPYQYHSGPAEKDPPRPTFRYLAFPLSLDHAASDFLRGEKLVLGESPGTSRLDGGEGMDHRALYGILYFPERDPN